MICSRCAPSASEDIPYRDQRAGRLHQLFDRAQCRRQRLHRRGGALPDLLRLGIECDRRRQDLLPGRPDILARQCRGAGPRHRLSSGSRNRDRSAAALAEPAGRVRHHPRAGRLCGLGLDPAADGRPRALDRDPARWLADPAADRDRDCRSRLLRAGDVRAGAGRTQSRLCRGRRDLCLGHAARLCQPFAGRARRVRCRHAGRAVADGSRRPLGGDAAVSRPLLYCAVRHIRNRADVSGGYTGRATEAPAPDAIRRRSPSRIARPPTFESADTGA